MKHKTQLLWVGLVALVLSAVLLFPFLEGKTLLPADTVKSMPLSEFGRDEMFQHGHVVQWIPYLFGGMPCYASVMVTPTYPVSIVTSWGLGSVMTLFRDPVILHVAHLLLLVCGAFLYLRHRGLGWLAAGFGAVTLGFSTTLAGLMGAGHTIKLWTVCWMPLNLYWLERLLEEKRLRLLTPAAITLGLMLSVKHVQMSWYFLLFAGVYTLVRLWQMRGEPDRAWLGAGLRALAWVGLALALTAFFLLPVLDYSGLSMRATAAAGEGGNYAAAYSFPPADLLSWWIPGAKGFGGSNYWGALEYTAFPLYAGALWLPFLVAAWFRAEDRRRLWPLMLPALLLFVLGLGKFTPFFPLLVKLLPGYAKLRAHMWALALTQMGLIFGAAIGLEHLLGLVRVRTKSAAAPPPAKTVGKKKVEAPPSAPERGGFPRPALVVLGLSIASLMLAGLFNASKPDPTQGFPSGDSYRHEMDEQRVAYFLYQQQMEPRPELVEQLMGQLRATRAAEFRGDAARTFLLVGVAGLALGLTMAGFLPLAATALLLGLVVAVDLSQMNLRTLKFEARREASSIFQAQGALGELSRLPDKHLFRIWPDGVYGTNEPAWHGLHSIDGYHGAKPAGIQRVLDKEGRVPQPDGSSTLHPAWLDILNVQWVISQQLPAGLEPIAQYPDGILLRNPDPLPRLSFPATWQGVPGDEQFRRIMDGADPHAVALVDPAPALPATMAKAEGRIVDYQPDRVEYRITSAGPALALLSEIWLPRGWVATLDGHKVPILRADHLLRAVALPTSGDHTLVLEYHQPKWILGCWISLITLVGLLLARFGWHRKSLAHPASDTQAE